MRAFTTLGILAIAALPSEAGDFLGRFRRPAPIIVYEQPSPPIANPVQPGPRIEAAPSWQTPLDLSTVQPIYLPIGGISAWPGGADIHPMPQVSPEVEKSLHRLDEQLSSINQRLAAMEKLLLIHDDMLRKEEKAEKK